MRCWSASGDRWPTCSRRRSAAELDTGIDRLGQRAADELAAYAAGPAFAAQAERLLEQLRVEYGDRPIGEVLTPARRDQLRAKADEWLRQFTEGPDLEGALRHFVEVQLERLGQDGQPLVERLPPGLVGTVEASINDYLPVAIERIGAVLSDPEAKGRIHLALRTAFDRAVRDLLLHERLLAKLVVTDQTFTRLLDGLERDGFERFAESLAAPEMRLQLTRAVNEGLASFLRIPLRDRLEGMGPEKRAALAGTLGDWLVAVARDETTRAVAARAVDRLLDASQRRTWNDLLGSVRPEDVARFVAQALAGEDGRRWVADATRAALRGLLQRPLGRPSAWLGPEMTRPRARGHPQRRVGMDRAAGAARGGAVQRAGDGRAESAGVLDAAHGRDHPQRDPAGTHAHRAAGLCAGGVRRAGGGQHQHPHALVRFGHRPRPEDDAAGRRRPSVEAPGGVPRPGHHERRSGWR